MTEQKGLIWKTVMSKPMLYAIRAKWIESKKRVLDVLSCLQILLNFCPFNEEPVMSPLYWNSKAVLFIPKIYVNPQEKHFKYLNPLTSQIMYTKKKVTNNNGVRFCCYIFSKNFPWFRTDFDSIWNHCSRLLNNQKPI